MIGNPFVDAILHEHRVARQERIARAKDRVVEATRAYCDSFTGAGRLDLALFDQMHEALAELAKVAG